ncbi:MAG: hypothetical protein QM750_11390 [Rubrivivax sp.]
MPLLRLLAGLLPALFTAAAQASAVPADYSTFVSVGVDGSGFKSSSGFGQISLDGAIGVATAQSGTGPAPFVSTEVTSSSGSDSVFARGNAQLLYYFKVVGPASSVPIPVLMTAQGSIDLLGTRVMGFAHYTVGVFGNVLFDERLCASFEANGPDNLPCNTTTSFEWQHDQTSFGALVDQDFYVALTVLAWAAEGGHAQAAIDPVFEIDLGFADAGLYQIVFSPGITQTLPDDDDGGGGGQTTVAEPPAPALLALALLPLLATARRRR